MLIQLKKSKIMQLMVLLMTVVIMLTMIPVSAANIGEPEYLDDTITIYNNVSGSSNPTKAYGIVSWQMGSSSGGKITFANTADTVGGGYYARLYTSPPPEGSYASSAAEVALMLDGNSTTDRSGKTFGLNNDNFKTATIKFRLKLANVDDENMSISFGYSPIDRKYTDNRCRLPYHNISDYIAATTEWQDVEVPLSLFVGDIVTKYGSVTGTEEADWSKFFVLAISIPAKSANLTRDIEMFFKDVKIDYQKPVYCTAETGLYKNGDNTGTIGTLQPDEVIYANVKANNATSAPKKMLLIFAVYKDGYMEHFEPFEVNVDANSIAEISSPTYTLPSDLTGVEAGVYLWTDFLNMHAYSDNILLADK